MYAFVSNDEMSAGLWSNSEFEGRNAGASSSGGSNNTRVMSVSEKKTAMYRWDLEVLHGTGTE